MLRPRELSIPSGRTSASRWLRVLGLGLLGLASATSCAPGEPAEARGNGMNVLLIVVDTLRADHLGIYGHDAPTSPRIDEFARGAMVFEGMYSQAPWTKPSIASLFTSLYPPQHRVLVEGTENQLSGSLTTLAEVLHQAGYRTGAASQNPHVQAKTGFDQGFAEFHGIPGYQSGVGEMLAIGKQFLDAGQGEPFFLYMHFLDPHGPYDPPAQFRREFLGDLKTDKQRVVAGRVGKMLDEETLIQEFEGSDLAYLEALYDAEIQWVDNAIGQLLDHLDERGLRENTLVIFTADHGEEFLDHGTVKHGYHVYDETVNVPLIIRTPGINVFGRNAAALAQHVDLMPTVLDLVEVEGPSEIQGRSLRSRLQGSNAPDEATVFSGTSWRTIERFAVRRGDWKLVRHEDEGRTELYNLREDPAETRDRHVDHPDLVRDLIESYRQTTAPIDGVTPDDVTGTSDPELERALQSLGYAGGDSDSHED